MSAPHPRPNGVDEEAWDLVKQLPHLEHRGAARRALVELTGRGWPTALDAAITTEQFFGLKPRLRAGLRRLWEEAVRQKLRTRPVPTRASKFEDCPSKVNAAAWALTGELERNHPTGARRGLRALAARGVATDLNVMPTAGQIDAMPKDHRLGLWALWVTAVERGIRTTALPLGMVMVDGKPPQVAPITWDLAGELRPSQCLCAREALRTLAFGGHVTNLNDTLPIAVFSGLDTQERWGLSALWQLAVQRGLRTISVPQKFDLWLHRKDLEGVDVVTIARVRRVCTQHHEVMAWIWLRRLRDAGLPTDLELDLDAPEVRDLIKTMLDQASRHELDDRVTTQLGDFRGMLRRLYGEAVTDGERTRPVPTVITVEYSYAKGTSAGNIARLPQEDQARLRKVEDHLRELARKQQGGRMLKVKRRPGEKKRTESQSTNKTRINALKSFLHHAAEWELDDLKTDPLKASPWRIEAGLLALMTPEHVARWVYRDGHKRDGSKFATKTIEAHHGQILRLLERAEEAAHPFVPQERRKAIAIELERCSVEEEWNVESDASWADVHGADGDDETGKWFPTLEGLRTGVARLKQRYTEAVIAHDNGDTFLRFWRATRDHVIAYGSFVCMWRVDTASTIDLSRAAPDPQTHKIRWRDGSIHIRYGARAKQAGNRSYFVKDLLIPAEVVDLIEILLKIEGRTLEDPLGAGENPVHLAVGDKWGRDELLDAPRDVVPLFRLDPNAPQPLTPGGVAKVLRKSLLAMGFDAINPHTMRAAGAIEWRFHRDRTFAAIMRLGEWTDENTLKRCYAHLTTEDLDNEIARGAASVDPTAELTTTQLVASLEEAHRKALALRLKPNASAAELAAAARTLRAAATTVDRAAGIETAERPPSKFSDPAHYSVVDQAIRPLFAGGLNQLLGYSVIEDARAKRTKPIRSDRRVLKRLRAEMARPTRAAANRKTA